MVRRIFVAGYATGTPSPGGFAFLIMLGTLEQVSRSQSITKTTSLSAALIGVREALRELGDKDRATIILEHQTAHEILIGKTAARHHEINRICNEIMTLVTQRQLDIDIIHTPAETMQYLTQVTYQAQQATARAWATNNSPACPKCHEGMQIKGEQWICTNENCNGKLKVYERGSM